MAIYACAPEIRVFAAAFCFAAAGLNTAGLTVCIAKGRRLLALVRTGLAAALLAAFAAMSIPQLYLWEGAVLPIPALFLPSSLLAVAALGAVSCLPGRESAHWPLFGARLGLAICALSALRFSCVALPAFAVCAAAEATAFLLWLKRAAQTPLPHLMARLARGLPVGVALYGASGSPLDENEAHALIRTRLGEAYAPCSAAESPVLIRSEERAYSVRAEVYRRGRRLVEIQDVTDHEAALAGERSVVEQLERGARLAAALAEQEGRAAILNSRDRAIQQLHDSVGQALAIVGLSLTLLQDPSEDGAAARRRISAARVRLEECLEHRDDALPLPLGEALALLREAYAALDVVILVAGEMPPLTPREEVSLLPICQEAIANAVRHGGVSEVCFTWQPGQGVILEISNSLPAGSSEFTEGVGLHGMRRRASEAGLHIAAAIRIDRFVLRVQKDNAH